MMSLARRLALVSLLFLFAVTGAEQAGCVENPQGSDTTSDSTPAQETEQAASEKTALQKRMQQEKQASGLLFSILPHKSNYLLPVSYNSSPNNAVYGWSSDSQESLDNLEVKFQISIKTPLWENIFGDNGTLYVAYSQLAFWQAYNTKISAPFREIIFEPEIFLTFNTGYEFYGITSQVMSIGFNHQSNGKSLPLSRNWNRIVANLLFNRGDTYLVLRPWFRIPEALQDDDNPNTEKYYGYGELQLIQKLGDHTLTMLLRNNLRTSGNKGAVQLDWSFPLHKKLRGYVQYFNGYGESLVDYNHSNNRVGIGVMLTDWL